MPDEPTPGGGSDIAGPTASPAGSSDDTPTPAAPPGPGDPYRWYGPSGHAYPGAESPTGFGGQYGTPQTPRGASGPAQGPYGQPHSPPYAWPYVPPPPQRAPFEERRRRLRRRLALGGVVILALGAGIGIGAAIAPTSPATAATALVSRAISAGAKAGTYHYVEKATFVGAIDDIEGDAAPNGGRQVIREECRPVPTATTSRTSFFDLRLVHGIVYFRGNLVAVVDVLGVPAAHATSIVGKWVEVRNGGKGEAKAYHTFEVGISTSSNFSELRTSFIPLSSKAVPGSSPATTEVVGALYRTKKAHRTVGTAALVIATSSGRPRTLRGSAVIETGHDTISWKFSGYGEKVAVPAPPHSVSYRSLDATVPAKGTCA